MRKWLLVAGVAVLAVVLVAAGLLLWRDHDRTELQRATSLAPADAERLSWTDWAGVRRSLDARVSASSSPTALNAFLDRAFDRDLSSTSALGQSAEILQSRYGFSPASAQWEMFSQSKQGAVDIIAMPDSTDFDDLASRLGDLGYQRPDQATGVWDGGEELLPGIGADLTPELQYVALDADRHLVFTSDTSDYLAHAVDHAGDGGPEDLTDVVDASGEPLSASIYSGDYTCSALAMGQADTSEQEQGAQLVAAAGKVNPIDAFAMSVQPDRHVEVVMGFENDDQARTNARSRARLASGPAPGQGGDFSDRFHLGKVEADGSLVTMDLRPVPGAYVLSDLGSGPLLFATC